MASVANQLLIDTKTGQRGEAGVKKTSFNQRQDHFVLYSKLIGVPVKPIKVAFHTSPNGVDWLKLHETELKENGQFDLEPVKLPMLSQCKVTYDPDLLVKVKKKNQKDKGVEERVAELKVMICYRDKK